MCNDKATLGKKKQCRCKSSRFKPHLEVGFAVEVHGFDVADAVGAGGGDEQQVGGEVVAVLDFDEISDTQILPPLLDELPVAVVYINGAVVELAVAPGAPQILPRFAQQAEREHEDERQPHADGAVGREWRQR